jgi:hypothetical protein
MTPLRFSGPLLPDGESREFYVVNGVVTYEPQAGAETQAKGWILPGLVDAHNHLGLEDGGAVEDTAEIEQQAIDDRDTGVLLTRDCGSPADTRWVQAREDLPRLIRCGRHIARTKRYLRNYGTEVEPEDLADAVAREAAAGDGWVKLVGDWISRDAGGFRGARPVGSGTESAAWDAVHRQWIDGGFGGPAFVTYLRHNAERLDGLLTGDIAAGWPSRVRSAPARRSRHFSLSTGWDLRNPDISVAWPVIELSLHCHRTLMESA